MHAGGSRPHSPYTIVLLVVAFTCRTHLIWLRKTLFKDFTPELQAPPYITAICCDRFYQWIKYVEHDRWRQNANSACFSPYTKWRFPGLIAQVLVIFTEYVLLLRTNAFHNIAEIFIRRNLLDLFTMEIYIKLGLFSKTHYLRLRFIYNHVIISTKQF